MPRQSTSTTHTSSRAKLFTTGGSQAVRLPAEFRFEGVSELFVRRDIYTGDLILSSQAPADWGSFMQLRAQVGAVPQDFLADRMQGIENRDPLAAWSE